MKMSKGSFALLQITMVHQSWSFYAVALRVSLAVLCCSAVASPPCLLPVTTDNGVETIRLRTCLQEALLLIDFLGRHPFSAERTRRRRETVRAVALNAAVLHSFEISLHRETLIIVPPACLRRHNTRRGALPGRLLFGGQAAAVPRLR